MHGLLLLVAGALAAACGCDGNATPAGTVLVDRPLSPQVAGSQAKLGEPAGPKRTTKTLVTIDPGEGGTLGPEWLDVRFRVDVTYGPVRVVSERSDYPSTWDVPQRLRIVVLDSGKFEIVPSCDDAIEKGIYMPDTPAEHEGLWLACQLDLRRRGGNTFVHVAAFGDGQIRVEPPRHGSARLRVEN
jgi:hypothetical protein